MAATDVDIHCSSGADISGRVKKKKRERDDEVGWNGAWELACRD